MKIKCPCVNCITLAICKASMKTKFGFESLRFRCSIFSEHYDYRYMNPDSTERKFLLQFFKPLHWEDRLDFTGGMSI